MAAWVGAAANVAVDRARVLTRIARARRHFGSSWIRRSLESLSDGNIQSPRSNRGVKHSGSPEILDSYASGLDEASTRVGFPPDFDAIEMSSEVGSTVLDERFASIPKQRLAEMLWMPEIKLTRTHELAPSEMRDRIGALADKIGGRLGGSWKWEGEVAVCEARGAKARVGYDTSAICVEISLPKAMRPFRRKLEAKIDEYLVGFLG